MEVEHMLVKDPSSDAVIYMLLTRPVEGSKAEEKRTPSPSRSTLTGALSGK